jgi:hypothetical protein
VEVRSIVDILDVGAVDAEDVVDAHVGEVRHHIVDKPVSVSLPV